MKLNLKKKLSSAKKKAKKKLSGAIKSVKKSLASLLKGAGSVGVFAIKVVLAAAILAVLFLAGKKLLSLSQTEEVKHPSEYTVKITNLEGNSGGSGSIIKTSPSESVIITNEHVCKGVLKKGGKVVTTSGSEHMVTGYVTGKEHDICVLTVAADLKNSLKIATEAPKLYSKATVTGHPALMPNLITEGHFGGREIISIMVGTRKCKDSDMKNPDILPYCIFLGVAPVIRNYESQVLSATIMAGSSGSAILNDKGELAGLVFAGSGRGISYTYAVPYEAVQNFLNNEASAIFNSKINSTREPEEKDEESAEEEMLSKESREALKEKCKIAAPASEKIKDFCASLNERHKL